MAENRPQSPAVRAHASITLIRAHPRAQRLVRRRRAAPNLRQSHRGSYTPTSMPPHRSNPFLTTIPLVIVGIVGVA